jgi:putative salt-induced outer membrane protein
MLIAAPFAAGAQDWRATDRTSARLAEAANGRKVTEGGFGAVAVGFIANTGNTRNTSLNAKVSAGYLAGRWRHVGAVKAIYGSNFDETTAEEYEASEQSDYAVGERSYLFAAFDYNTNRFGSYRRRATEVVGTGRRVLDSAEHILDLQIGVGARQTRLLDGGDQEETIVSLTGNYDWIINPDASFAQRVSVQTGADNTYTESVSGLKVKIEGDLSLSVSFTIKHNSQVPADRTHTDTSTLVSLIYGL